MIPSRRRTALGIAVLLAGTLAAALATLATGSYALPPAALWAALHGTGDPAAQMVVLGLRLPRLAAAMAAGASLGVAGAVFQAVCHNPLASPDVIGTTAGSATGALLGILVLGQTRTGVTACSVAGGLLAAIAIARLSAGRFIGGERLILIGIGLSATLSAANEYLVTRAELESALAARTWLYGSLNGVAWPHVLPAALGAAVLLPCSLLLAPRLRLLELGDDLAAGLGLDVARSRLGLLAVAVGLAALATGTAGPVHFLALVAAPLARSVCRSSGTSLAAAGAMGMLLMVVADLAAQRVLAPFQLPVGLITSAVGGAYLIHVLSRTNRIRH